MKTLLPTYLRLGPRPRLSGPAQSEQWYCWIDRRRII